MQIDISSILNAYGASEKWEFILDEETFKEDLNIKNGIKVKIELTNTGESILARGNIEVEVEQVCGICLKDYFEKLNFDFEERFISSSELVFGEREEYELNPNDIFFAYQDLTIEVDEMVRELIILNLPIAPKCDINCKIEQKDTKRIVDPRFEILKNFKVRGE